MTKPLIALACALALSAPLAAQEAPKEAPSPGEIVAAAPASEWVTIAPEDLLVMTLAPDAKGKPRQVVIQLMPAPFSQGWVGNIRTLARAHWYDGIAVVRVQDNYVVQWGDPNNDNPEATGPAKALPDGLKSVPEACYRTDFASDACALLSAEELAKADNARADANAHASDGNAAKTALINASKDTAPDIWHLRDSYAPWVEFYQGWPLGGQPHDDGWEFWPTHCYGMVGVGRNLSPDTGTGAELYTVIGHAPRHLDRNIALVGRVVEGIENLSSLPRGTGDLGFYKTAQERTPIVSIRVASDLPPAERPRFEYLNTDGEAFARYTDARANRHDAFFNVPAGGADICNIPVPVRRVKG